MRSYERSVALACVFEKKKNEPRSETTMSSSSSNEQHGVKRSASAADLAAQPCKRARLAAPNDPLDCKESHNEWRLRMRQRVATRAVTSDLVPKRGFALRMLHVAFERGATNIENIVASDPFLKPFLRDASYREAALELALGTLTPECSIGRAARTRLFEPHVLDIIMEFTAFKRKTFVRNKHPSDHHKQPCLLCVDEIANEVLVFTHTEAPPSSSDAVTVDVYSIAGVWSRSFEHPVPAPVTACALARNRVLYLWHYGKDKCSAVNTVSGKVVGWIMAQSLPRRAFFAPGCNAIVQASRISDSVLVNWLTSDGLEAHAQRLPVRTLVEAPSTLYQNGERLCEFGTKFALSIDASKPSCSWTDDDSKLPPPIRQPHLECNDWFICAGYIERQWDGGVLVYNTHVSMQFPNRWLSPMCASAKHNLFFYVDTHVHVIRLPRRERETAY